MQIVCPPFLNNCLAASPDVMGLYYDDLDANPRNLHVISTMANCVTGKRCMQERHLLNLEPVSMGVIRLQAMFSGARTHDKDDITSISVCALVFELA